MDNNTTENTANGPAPAAKPKKWNFYAQHKAKKAERAAAAESEDAQKKPSVESEVKVIITPASTEEEKGSPAPAKKGGKGTKSQPSKGSTEKPPVNKISVPSRTIGVQVGEDHVTKTVQTDPIKMTVKEMQDHLKSLTGLDFQITTFSEISTENMAN